MDTLFPFPDSLSPLLPAVLHCCGQISGDCVNGKSCPPGGYSQWEPQQETRGWALSGAGPPTPQLPLSPVAVCWSDFSA